MHYEDIGNIAMNALLSFHSNKQDSNISPKGHMRKYLTKIIESKSYSACIKRYYKGFLDRSASNPISFPIEKKLLQIYNDSQDVTAHLQNFESISLKDRFDSMAKRLSEAGLSNLSNYRGSADEIPKIDKGIFVWGKDYDCFDESGDLTQSINIRIKTDDLFVFAKIAYECGLLLSMDGKENILYDFTLSPGNNSEGAAYPLTDRESFVKRRQEMEAFLTFQLERFNYGKKNVSTKKTKKKRKK